MGQVVFEGAAPYRVSGVRGASAAAKDRTVELEFWVGDEGTPKSLFLRLSPDMALGLSRMIVPAVTTAKHQKAGE